MRPLLTSLLKEDIFMTTTDALNTRVSTPPEPGGVAEVPPWLQLPERSLAWFVEQDRPFEMEVAEQGRPVTRRVDAVIDYPPAPGARFVPVTEMCVDPGKAFNKAGGIRQREIVDVDGMPV